MVSGATTRKGTATRFVAYSTLPITVTTAMVPTPRQCTAKGDRSYGFFFPVDEDHPATSSGEVVLLEVTELDEDGQPAAFELVTDEAIAAEAYADFQEAAKGLYDFA